MCGFFAIVFDEDRDDLGEILVRAAGRLSYRGYDSVGAFAIDSSGNWDLRKAPGKVDEVNEKLKLHELRGYKGLVQLRWATFGTPSVENAQPHTDCDNNLVGAHNGNIVNSPVLRDELIAKGHRVRGQNDGEILVHVVEDALKKTGDMVSAIVEAARILRGDYAYAITKMDERRFFAVKKGSSLFVGVGDGFICASSDQVSILELTRRIIPMNDGEFVEFTHNRYILRHLSDGSEFSREPIVSQLSPETATKGGYPHFMSKEIHEEPQKVAEVVHLMTELDAYDLAAQKILDARRPYIVGSGTSYHAALMGSYFTAKVAGTEIIPSVAAEFPQRHGDTVSGEDILIAVSQSGETKDVIHCVNVFRERTGREDFIGVVNVLGSTLAMKAEPLLPIASDLEISVPATKTFMNQMVLLLYLAFKLAEHKGIEPRYPIPDFERIPELLRETIQRSKPLVEQLIDRIGFVRAIHILGYGITFPIALEGALKIKEVVYTNSEGMHSGEFKHGPLAIVEPGYPVIFVSTVQDRDMMLSHIHEVKTRRGFVVTIAPHDDELKKSSDFYMELPESDYLITPILAVVPLQLLAYRWSVIRGIDPDFPKNISKTLTVF